MMAVQIHVFLNPNTGSMLSRCLYIRIEGVAGIKLIMGLCQIFAQQGCIVNDHSLRPAVLPRSNKYLPLSGRFSGGNRHEYQRTVHRGQLIHLRTIYEPACLNMCSKIAHRRTKAWCGFGFIGYHRRFINEINCF